MLKYLFLAGLMAIAVLPRQDAVADDCANANTQLELNTCADQEFEEADVELNRVYNRLKARPNDDVAAKLLTKAQRVWLAFRDAECAYATSKSVGGSIYPMLVVFCRTGLTRDRTADLREYLKAPGR